MKISLDDFILHIKNGVDELNLKNVKDKLQDVRKNLDILETLFDVGMLTEDESYRHMDENARKKKENEYVFKKLLSGGTFKEEPNSFVMESVARSLNLESGDLVRVDDLNNTTDTISLIEKNWEKIEDSFEIYPFAPVKLDRTLNMLYCDEYYSDERKVLKIDDTPYRHIINKEIISKLNISEGDILDLGMYLNNPRSFRVVWKHETDEYSTPKKSSYYKDKVEKQENKLFNSIDLKGKKVLIIGCIPRKRHYGHAIEECNGEFLFLSGDEGLERNNSTIDNADVVLILKDFLSHVTVRKSVEHSKSVNKPFTVVDGTGIQTILFEARRLIG